MTLRDSLQLATSIFVHNRLRTVFTILAVGVGIGSIVFLISLGYGLERVATERFANATALRTIDVRSLPASGKALTAEALNRIRELGGIDQVLPVVQLAAQLRSKAASVDITAFGVNPTYFEIEGLQTSLGELSLSPGSLVITSAVAELLEQSPEAIVGQSLELTVIAERAKLDEEVNLGAQRVVGVIINPTAATVYLSAEPLLPLSERDIQSAKVMSQDVGSVRRLKAEITTMGYEAQTTIEDVESLERGFRIGRTVFLSLGLIAVAVASIGLLNTMTISLLERIREVGVMKALGASDRDVWQLFLAESALLGTFGGLAGLLLGRLLASLTNTIFNRLAARFGGTELELFATPFFFGLGVIVFGLIVGALTGIYPARRAAKLNPVDALRYE